VSAATGTTLAKIGLLTMLTVDFITLSKKIWYCGLHGGTRKHQCIAA
jgi:hypothetical protein